MEIILNPLVLIGICIVVGNLLGKISIGHFKLGSSGTLFIGLFISYGLSLVGYETSIPSILFKLSLIGFIVSVGLKASGSIKAIIKTYGIKFVVLAFVVTLTGATSSYFAFNVLAGLKFEIIGTYLGALTSSPGLATALELAKAGSVDASANVGLGYAIAYVPGVVLVILFSQFYGKIAVGNKKTESIAVEKHESFDVIRFIIVVVIGVVIGSLKVNIGLEGSLSLGTTGGVLISALFMGSTFKKYKFNEDNLNTIRDIALNSFLSIVGLKYGVSAISAIADSGLQLLIVGMITGIMSISIGFIIGKYVLKMEDSILIGGICGGMTSTPGLAAASEAFKSDSVTVGYGATYPFALIGMIIFTNILFY